MSALTELVATRLTEANDITKVLDDIAAAFKSKGFLDDSSGVGALVKSFQDSLDNLINNVAIDDEENLHEISNSFVVESSKFTKSSNISMENESKVNEDMFGESDDSFEIPETQVLPPDNHSNDEFDSEGFVVMPNEGVEENDCSQSQVLLNGIECQRLSPIPQELDDFDLEMSKLRWDDSTKEIDESKSASVTPDLEFPILNKPNADAKSDSCTKIKDQNSVRHENLSDKSFTNVENITTKEKGDEKSSREESVGPEDIGVQNGEKDDWEVTQLFKKPGVPEKEKANSDNVAPDDKCDEINDFDQTKVFFKSNIPSSNESNDEDDIYNVATQIDEATKNAATSNQNFISSSFHEMEKEEIGKDEAKKEAVVVGKEEKKVRKFVFQRRNRIISSDDEPDVEEKPNSKAKAEKSNEENFDDIKLDPHEEKLLSDLKDADYTKLCKETNQEQSETNFASYFDQLKELRTLSNSGSIATTDVNKKEGTIATTDVNKKEETIARTDVNEKEETIATTDVTKKEENVVIPEQKSRTRRKLKISEPIDTETSTSKRQKARDLHSTESDQVKERNLSKRGKPADDLPVELQPTQVFVKPSTSTKSDKGKVKNLSKRGKPTEDQSEVKYLPKRRKQPEDAPVELPDTQVFVKPSTRRGKPVENAPEGLPDTEVFVKPSSSTKSDDVKVRNLSRRGKLVEDAPEELPDTEVFVKPSSSTKSDDVKVRKSRKNGKTNEDAPVDMELLATQVFVKSSSTTVPHKSSKKLKTTDDVPMELQPTQVFLKATSTPKDARKEAREDVKVQTRRTARSTATESVNNIKKMIAAQSNSVSYSPRSADAKVKLLYYNSDASDFDNLHLQVSSDVKENISRNSSGNNDTSGEDSKRGTKRKAGSDISSNSEESFNDSSKNRTSRKQNYLVMFTMIDPAPYLPLLKELKLSMADSSNYNVLVTDRIYRTSKFMCALASGKPIVALSWLNEMKKRKSVVDPFEFLLNDPDGEKKYKFSLAKTLGEVRKHGGLFQNHSVLVTPSTTPPPEILKDIITCSGGKYLKSSLVARKGDTVICITDQKDQKQLPGLKKKYSSMKELTHEKNDSDTQLNMRTGEG
ncbi:Mediator of DNA damage checkpoint protein 1, partial [Pseudolycoriella hygida]